MTSTERQLWLNARKSGIGGSDAAAILGRDPWKTNVDLWEIKTGKKQQPDISDKPYIIYGTKAEAPLADLFALDFPQYEVINTGFNIIRHKEYPFLLASLDRQLIERATGRKGFLEVKTATISTGTQLEQWNGRIPENYYCQIVHYFNVTDAEFGILKVQLKNERNGVIWHETRHYFFERKDVLEDATFLEEHEIKFWRENVEKGVRPNLILPAI